MSLLNGLITGILGYSKTNEFAGGEGLGIFFKSVETYNYECYVTDYSQYSPNYLQSQIINIFSNLYSGSVDVKAFQIPGDYNLPNNDAIRAAKFIVNVQVRLPVTNFSSQSEITNNNMFRGISNTLWTNYSTLFQNFNETYNYSKREDGSLETNHALDFSLLTGGYNAATGIAGYVYAGDISNYYATTLTSGTLTPILIDPTLARQYYSETYDLQKNKFSFNKQTTYPPLNSDSTYSVNKNIKNSMVLSEDGITTVVEEGKIKAYSNYNQSVSEYQFDLNNGKIYNRCNSLYNSFSIFTNSSGSLNNYPIKNEVVFNKPAMIVDYNVSYNDNPNFSTGTDILTYKTTKIELIQNKYTNISQSYDFTKIGNINLGQTGLFLSLITGADNDSISTISGIYQKNELYNSYLPNLPRIKETFSLPNRKRNFNATFLYSNEPIYFINIGGYTYPKLQYKILDNKPEDKVNEYIIINRPSKNSILSYQYQTEKGSKTMSINGFLPRNYGYTFTSPISINTNFLPIFSWSIQQLLNSFSNQNILALAYALSDVKITFDSENQYNISVVIDYVKKLYT